jgi:hypothetical protein
MGAEKDRAETNIEESDLESNDSECLRQYFLIGSSSFVLPLIKIFPLCLYF